MTGVRVVGGTSAARSGARYGAVLAVWAVLGVATSASALPITGGPMYTLPGGGSCTVSGTPTITSPNGATVTCTGVNLAAHSNVYFGIRNDINVNGNTMTGAAPSGAAVFGFSTSGASSITYTSTTSFTSASGAVSPATQTVSNRLILRSPVARRRWCRPAGRRRTTATAPSSGCSS